PQSDNRVGSCLSICTHCVRQKQETAEAPARNEVGRITQAAGPPLQLGHTRSRASHRATHAMIQKEPYAPNPIDMVQKRRRSEEHTSELQSRFDLVCRL